MLSLAGTPRGTKDRLQTAVERGELPRSTPFFLGEMLTGPVHLMVSRGARTFTRADAHQVSAIVLAGVRATAAHDGAPVAGELDVDQARHAGPR